MNIWNQMRWLVVLLGLVILCHSVARAEQEYIKPTYEDMLHTAIRFGALSIGDDLIIDDYAIVNECELFQKFNANDFQWQRIREGIRQLIRQNYQTWPTSYLFESELQLDRYDFEEKIFKFKDKATIKNVNAFVIFSTEGRQCGNQAIKLIPKSFRAVLDQPIYFTGIPLGEKDAEALLARMVNAGNSDRIIHARFKLRITYISPMERLVEANNSVQPKLVQGGSEGTLRMEARLDGLEIYEDAQFTRLLFNYQP